MAVGGSNAQPLLTDEDAPFELHRIIASTNVPSEITDISPNYFNVNILDKGSNRLWTTTPIEQRIITATGRGDRAMKRQVVLQPRSSLLFTFTNLHGSLAVIATVTFEGFKLVPITT